ncbi:FtsK/SpoIIIE domain-containing protein [Corynebacterium suicordis]|uniref:Cell division protein FtsK n=1 Tax=Corynebacterium suicordis DSM 45110 TaxID=1121369 RepID=A0ABR9ZHV0_9CORY|nr:FtsK/SpoIIIE domain-containing protein [Corynebacterium suicordis]MBF4552930.1 cell division protein FtsK [Corynebacterium suicordis DSM 45110]MDR6278110.1 S-DNA-T family DNA segregation ATPase FtsK/SpoIIIE [Corynebacterium suicordis]
MQSQAPPTLPKDKQPFIRMLMPAVMLVAVMGMIGAMVLSGAGRSPMTFIFPLMMLGSMAMMFSPGTNVDELRRAFHRHLDALKDSLQRTRGEQLERMAQAYPDPHTLWTHLLTEADVTAAPGIVRLGTAVQAPEDPLEIPVSAPPEDLEPVCAMSLRDLALHTATIEAPVAVDLHSFHCVVLTGLGAQGLANAMQAQLVMQDADVLSIAGPFQEWLPHDGPRKFRFCDGSHPVTSGAVVVEPSAEWLETAKGQGLLLHIESEPEGGVLSAWTMDGWAPFGVADFLSTVELAQVCRARSLVRGSTSLLELPGGDLRAPIGHSGAPVYLDIKESALGGIGPHGLCIGATGSGKSELLKSIVISFAHSHSHRELNFILVDFKGGASFLGMERLPHTSAVITNLSDEAGLVDRMQDSLLGEMHRRQERLRAAGLTTARQFNTQFPGEMPALFIIVDEFSELLHARPEFAEVFAAIGRLGRSLGMHLLLASQRLEEGRLRGLESHLSYRIALRTFSAAESRALIGSSAAYELPATPGAAILFAHDATRFQSAYVSGPELPRDQRLIRRLGMEVESTTTTVELVVDRLAAPTHNQVWLPLLPTHLPAWEILKPVDSLQAQVALEDLPFEGEQIPYVVDMNRRHWAIVGQPRTGKTGFLRALITGLALSSPGVPIYVFDPGGSLRDLARLPQVAAVVGADQLSRLLDEVELLDGPRVLIIDGVEQLGDEEQRVIRFVTTGMEQGLHVAVSSLRWNFRPALRDMLTGIIEFKMTALDAHFRDAQRSLPEVAGRAVSHRGKHIQIAVVTPQDIEHVRRVTAERGELDRQMKVLPEVLHRVETSPESFAVGGPTLDSVVWDFATFPHFIAVGQSGSGVTTALQAVIDGVGAQGGVEKKFLITDARRGLLGNSGYATPEHFRDELRGWAEILRARIPSAEVTAEQLKRRTWWHGPELFVVVDDADVDPGLDPLIPLLPYAGDIGLHVVMGRRSGAFARASYQPLLQAMRDQTVWLLLSAPREDGPIAGQKLCRRPPGRAMFVHRDPWLVHVVTQNAGDKLPQSMNGANS